MHLEVALYGLAEVLAHDADHGAGEEEDDASLAVQLERPAVDVHVLELEVFGDVLHQMGHQFLTGKNVVSTFVVDIQDSPSNLWFARSLELELLPG